MESCRGERADPAGLTRFGDARGELLDRFAGDAARADLVAGVQHTNQIGFAPAQAAKLHDFFRAGAL